MFVSLKSALLLAAVAKLCTAAATSCNRDNLLRCFSATPAPASAYCSSFLGTSTVVASTTTTGTPTATDTALVTTTDSSSVTNTLTTTVSTTTFAVSSTTIYTTDTVTQTVTVFVSPGAKKRELNEKSTFSDHVPNKYSFSDHVLVGRDVATPACLTKDGTASTSYPAFRISSACTCIGVTQATISVTSTASAVDATTTRTATVTTTVTSSVYITMTSTITVSQTLTQYTASVTITGTTTTTAVCPDASGTGSHYGTGYTIFYRQFYTGSGQRLNDNNPGNRFPNRPRQDTTFDMTYTFCNAVSACARFAAKQTAGYYTFALFKTTSDSYQCTAYYEYSSDPSYFNVPDSSVKFAVGFVMYNAR